MLPLVKKYTCDSPMHLCTLEHISGLKSNLNIWRNLRDVLNKHVINQQSVSLIARCAQHACALHICTLTDEAYRLASLPRIISTHM